MEDEKQKVALVFGTLPSVHDIDQFQIIQDHYNLQVIASESICGYLTQTSYFDDLSFIALPEYDENPTYLPGLEKVLAGFDLVIVKERIGLYAYQCVKAKWKNRFRLMVWVDNFVPFPSEDIDQMRVIRSEVTSAVDGFIVQSEETISALKLEGVDESRICRLNPFVQPAPRVDKQKSSYFRKELGIAESSFVICYVGAIEWEDNLAELVHGIKLAVEEKPALVDKIRLLVCGIGSYSVELRDAFVRYGIDHIPVYIGPNRRAMESVYAVSDIMYVSSISARDRVDGDPYRILAAMANRLPVLASRGPVTQEYTGKHRIDFCQGSIRSLAEGIIKAEKSQGLLKDLANKNLQKVEARYNKDKARQEMLEMLPKVSGMVAPMDQEGLDHQVKEVEARVNNKQYLAAIDIIENIFKEQTIPVHHRGNLYRLIGDCFAKLGDNEAAKNAYIQAADLDPYAPKTYIGLGTLGLVKSSFDIAVLHFQKAVSLAPADEMANLGLGLAFQGVGEKKEALKWVVKSLEANLANTAAIFTLVKISHEIEDFNDAITVISRYLEYHPNDYNMIYTLSGVFFKVGRFEDCLEMVNKIVKVDPMDAKAHTLAQQASRALEATKVS